MSKTLSRTFFPTLIRCLQYRPGVWLLLCLLSGPLLAEPLVLKVPKAQDSEAVSQDYFIGLLNLALEAAADGRALPNIEETAFMEQGRATYEVLRGELVDVFWMGVNADRVEHLRAIPIPLTRGLIGYRRAIIHQKYTRTFTQITRLEELARFTACQGLSWPDTAILREAGLLVRELAGGNEGLFRAVIAGRCDYYPRGFFEAPSEIARYQPRYPDIVMLDSLVLHYPFAVYFFVSPHNEALALWIENGLERMIDDGSLLRYIHQHPLTAGAFPLVSSPHWLSLNNSSLPANTDPTNRRYWFVPEDFKEKAPSPQGNLP